jgi:hypothetical protein
MIEETPYTVFRFPRTQNDFWFTRPESTGLYSIKSYTHQAPVTVEAGTFDCDKIHIMLLPAFRIPDFTCEQWICGNVVVKQRTTYGDAEDAIGETRWDSYALTGIDNLSSHVGALGGGATMSWKCPSAPTTSGAFLLNGRAVGLWRDERRASAAYVERGGMLVTVPGHTIAFGSIAPRTRPNCKPPQCP